MPENMSRRARDYRALGEEALSLAQEEAGKGHYLRAATAARRAALLFARADTKRGGLRKVGAC